MHSIRAYVVVDRAGAFFGIKEVAEWMLVDDAAVLATVSINVEETALQVVREAGRRGGGRGKRKKTIRIRKGSGSATVETQRKVWWQDRRGK